MQVAAAASNPTAGGGAALSAEHSRLTYLARMKRIGRVGGSLRWDVGDRPWRAAPQPAARRFGLPAARTKRSVLAPAISPKEAAAALSRRPGPCWRWGLAGLGFADKIVALAASGPDD